MFEALLAVAAFFAAAIASLTGFGIGSILTPLFSLELGTRAAVAAVSIPHFVATSIRLFSMRRHIDTRVLLHFGILSAAGGLAGAFLHSTAANRALSYLLAVLLAFAGAMTLSGSARKLRFGRRTAWIAGALSGTLGGLIGNQGGIRSAALLGFGLDRHALVATATATGVIVDAARVPVYFATSAADLRAAAFPIGLATLACVLGTWFGTRILRRIPDLAFRRLLGVLLIILAIAMFFRAAANNA